MNTLLRFSTLLLLSGTGFYACKQNTATTPVPTPPVAVVPAPTISSVMPDTGMAGMEIIITGANLKGVREVKFGSLTALVTLSETGKLVVICPDFGSVQRVPVSIQTSSGTADGQSFTGAPALVIDKKICAPAGVIPGAFITLKGKNFGKVTQVNFSNTTVTSNQFTFNDSTGITLKVPANTKSGKIWMVNEYGSSQGVQFDLLTGGDGLNTSNIATNVGTITTGTISDGASPKSFFYCIPFFDNKKYHNTYPDPQIFQKDDDYPIPTDRIIPDGTRLTIGFKVGPNTFSGDTTTVSYKTEQIGGTMYYIFRGYYHTVNGQTSAPAILKLERNSQNTNYTGAIIFVSGSDFFGDIYIGNMITKGEPKNMLINGDIYAYSVITGKQIHLCSQTTYGKCSACQ